jgi:hypothetical protein
MLGFADWAIAHELDVLSKTRSVMKNTIMARILSVSSMPSVETTVGQNNLPAR